MRATGVLSFLMNPYLRVLFFGGKGGVGKTNCAAAAALYQAHRFPRRAVLLVSTDPAHSLADSFGELQVPNNLKILEFNAPNSLENFKSAHRDKLVQIAARGTFLDEVDIGPILELSLPGLDEFMALLAIADWVETQAYDLIIVDTAPTGHTLRLLNSPELIRTWLKALDTLLAKHRFMQASLQGSYQRDELDDFLLELAGSVKQMRALLQDPSACRFVPVMLAEALVINETRNLLGELANLHIPVNEIIVNRLVPENFCPFCSEVRRDQQRLCKKWLTSAFFPGCTFRGLPLYTEEIRGPLLENLWDEAFILDPADPVAPASQKLPTRVEAPASCPPLDITFLIFAGKGGVGKTTLACATALRLAQELPSKEILLFSTDPAHSLSACLDKPVGSDPVPLAPGLTAMEIDAPGEFASLKAQYRRELSDFFQDAFENFDAPFDRQVMEHIFDPSPPGLDEIMALMRVMEFLNQGRYEIFILDSAPTGHLLRLLELPGLIDQWLKTFFGLLLKYKLTFRFPELSQQLVKISRHLKLLRNLWSDPERSALYAVSILTEMAFQESSDLLAACQRLGISVPTLFLNLATAARDCALCTALNQREALIKNKFAKTFPGHQTVIYRQSEPRGLESLQELGRNLFRSRKMENQHGAVINLPALSK
jgi:arsenite/tail-anchored protein-transporting ATPase